MDVALDLAADYWRDCETTMDPTSIVPLSAEDVPVIGDVDYLHILYYRIRRGHEVLSIRDVANKPAPTWVPPTSGLVSTFETREWAFRMAGLFPHTRDDRGRFRRAPRRHGQGHFETGG
jgi:hypothetical protein